MMASNYELLLKGRELIAQGNLAELEKVIDYLISCGHTQELCHIVAKFKNTALHAKALAVLENTCDSYKLRDISAQWYYTQDFELGKLVENKGFVMTYSLRMKIFTALKTGRSSELTHWTGREIKILLEALSSPDPTVATQAKILLFQLTGEKALNLIARFWAETNQSFLLEVLLQHNFLPKKPLETRVRVALKTNNYEALTGGRAGIIEPLAKAAEDDDPEVREAARCVLQSLKRPALLKELARLAIEQNLPVATQVLVEQGYIPQATTERILFYFVTEQWDKYDRLDFDCRVLRTYYETASQATRRHLAAKVRTAGRVEYLSILSGTPTRSRSSMLASEEAELLVKILAANGEWATLWPLVFELPLEWSLKAMRVLAASNWRPASSGEQSVFEELRQLAWHPSTQVGFEEAEITRAVPPAILQATFRLDNAQINDLAFSPKQDVVALTTSGGKIVLWNWQSGQREHILEGVEHIGRVAFVPDGSLLCGQVARSKRASCAVYLYRGNGQAVTTLATLQGSVTALAGLTEGRAFTAGRDGLGTIWHLASGKREAWDSYDYGMDYWVRGTCTQPNRALLLGRKVSLVRLPDLLFEGTVTWISHKPIEHAAFLPDDKGVVLGSPEGHLYISWFYNEQSVFRKRLEALSGIVPPNLPVRGLASLRPELGLIGVAGGDGKIKFISWPGRETRGIIHTAPNLQNMRVSPEGHFMVLTYGPASLSVWDLRPLELRPLLVKTPLAHGGPLHLAAIDVLRKSEGNSLPPPVKVAVDYIEVILRHRLRFDIEVAEEHNTTSPGKFDIEIEAN